MSLLERVKQGLLTLAVKRILLNRAGEQVFLAVECRVLGTETDLAFRWSLNEGGKAGEAALANIKQFFCALFGLDGEQLDPGALQEIAENYTGNPGDADSVRASGMLIHALPVRWSADKWVGAENRCFPKFSHVSGGNSKWLGADAVKQ